MSEEQEATKQTVVAEANAEAELPLPWQRIQGAIWLLGLAVLFWQGWWWPGILVLAAISGLTQGLIQLYLQRQQERQALTVQRANWLPSKCPNCGAPISVAAVNWTGPDTADCPYCNTHLRNA